MSNISRNTWILQSILGICNPFLAFQDNLNSFQIMIHSYILYCDYAFILSRVGSCSHLGYNLSLLCLICACFWMQLSCLPLIFSLLIVICKCCVEIALGLFFLMFNLPSQKWNLLEYTYESCSIQIEVFCTFGSFFYRTLLSYLVALTCVWVVLGILKMCPCVSGIKRVLCVCDIMRKWYCNYEIVICEWHSESR